ncbi:MAG TPA: hypothetical protein VHX66_17440 [Solirubrobacteraceae bacterium]|jgi:hypothetical protein|nr:hypothetical protein [Solirubrobacteraceae bacterium]
MSEAIDGAAAELVAIEGIRHAARERVLADDRRRLATLALREYCLAAQAAGVSITRIAREAHLSRQGLYDLLRQPS